MEKKYELTSEFIIRNGVTLYRIKATRDFSSVKAGELGGFIEKESNLSHDGNAWVSGDAKVYDNARVYGNAWVSCMAQVYGNAQVYGSASICGGVRVYDNAKVYDAVDIIGFVKVHGNAKLYGYANLRTGEFIG